jgi:hypothetical protein
LPLSHIASWNTAKASIDVAHVDALLGDPLTPPATHSRLVPVPQAERRAQRLAAGGQGE